MPSPNFESTASTCLASPLSPAAAAADGSAAAPGPAPRSLRDYCFQLELQRRSSRSLLLQPTTNSSSTSNRRATPDQDDDDKNGNNNNSNCHKRPRLGRQERFQFLISVLDKALSIPFDSGDDDILQGAWALTTTPSQTPRSTRDSQ